MENWVRVQDLGEGSYGVVWLEKKGQEAVRAVKKVSKANIILNQRELYALKELKEYPEYFVELLGSSEDQNSVYLVMEYIENGDLMGVVKNRQGTDRISENEIKSITWQLLTALEIMHSKNFCHRDLKPQNILVASTSPIRVKIADFGVTKQASDSTQLRTVVGTWGYMAPEVLGFSDAETSGYTSSADIWSLGSLLHFMFTNEVPFPDNRKLINYVRENNAPFPTEKLQRGGASLAARDFIKSLMSPFPEKRLTAKQALEAPWLKIDEPDQISPDPVLESFLPNDPELTVSLPNG
ncbi:Pkinase-domain-containing protein [Morchella conica CCBAS932]|uniref:non-specific serine/threonine protein kinase n=1 Tax=Morchella conica CCBAS932 TaxID=1392247 RepID=A0A3N4KZE9_9PEZI|nr:Pkinase-domain-containing protein [Morchella conica CCBAS932]